MAMPFGSEGVEDTIGLALSGGGFRATLFHIGSLRRLLELGVLSRLSRFSSVSGGSITSGVLALAWNRLQESGFALDTFIEQVETPLRAFCRRSVDVRAAGEGLLLPFRRASDAVADEYRRHLFEAKTLQDLPDTPNFVFMATNLQTGRGVRFSKAYLGDYLIGLVRSPMISLATTVAASSAFPPFLSPVLLEEPGRFEAVEGSVFNQKPEYTKVLWLTDGGVYDNLGLQTVWNRCRTILASDAGAPFAFVEGAESDWVRQTLRALDIATDQARGLRKLALVDDYQRKERSGAYWGIDTRIRDYPLADVLPCDEALVAPLAQIRTRLSSFDDAEQGALINWGYALCDAALRSYGAALVPGAVRPFQWPAPDQALGNLS
jgi:NTE family protein